MCTNAMHAFTIKQNESSAVIKSLQPPPGFLFVSSAGLAQLLILRNRAHAFSFPNSKKTASAFYSDFCSLFRLAETKFNCTAN